MSAEQDDSGWRMARIVIGAVLTVYFVALIVSVGLIYCCMKRRVVQAESVPQIELVSVSPANGEHNADLIVDDLYCIKCHRRRGDLVSSQCLHFYVRYEQVSLQPPGYS